VERCAIEPCTDFRILFASVKQPPSLSAQTFSGRTPTAASGSGTFTDHVTPTLEDILEASQKIASKLVRTPCTRSRTLSDRLGASLYLKFENLQFTASFKERGALNKLLSLSSEQRERGVIAVSAGNHAQAVAYHARELGIPATIVMPRTTPNVKVENTRTFGAEILLVGNDLETAARHADQVQHERGLVRVHPYDDPEVVCGQGSLAVEILEQVPEAEVLVIPIGGGGLISGCALAAKGLRPEIEIVGVQASRYATVRALLENGPAVRGGPTIADGIAVKSPGQIAREVIRTRVDHVCYVDEQKLEEAVALLLEIEKTVAEGAGAASVAALLQFPERFSGRNVVCVLSGGNIDHLVLASILQRSLVRAGRLARLRLELDDQPGALAKLAQLLAEADANIVEVHHQRSFTAVPLRSAEVELILQTRGLPHMREILERLAKAGYTAQWLDAAGVKL